MKRRSSTAVIRNLIFSILLIVGAPVFGQTPLKILISNDDGIEAPGLAALYEALSKIGTVTVAAPAQNTSGVSHSVMAQDPIFVVEKEKNGSRWFAIKATPATCVRMAIESLLEERPDVVVSGINNGVNLGTVTFYSATIGSAREAAFVGIPAIAVNLAKGKTMDYGPAAAFTADLVKRLKDLPLQPGTFLNVNVPNLPPAEIKGVMAVPQDTRPPLQFYEKRVNPWGQIYYWNTYKEHETGDRKTDIWAIRNGYIALTPFQIDQTNSAALTAWQASKIVKGRAFEAEVKGGAFSSPLARGLLYPQASTAEVNPRAKPGAPAAGTGK
jgi:5'-nucleotidase